MRFFDLAHVSMTLILLATSTWISLASAITLDPTQPDQVRSVAKNVAEVLVSMYANMEQNKILSGIPGLLTYPPYYWWEAGAMFGQLIDYWYYTNDSTWNNLVKEGILHQRGDQWNFMPANQSKDEGNDDQLFWAFTLMSAAENNFSNPPNGTPGWLAMAQGIFNQLWDRWDPTTCGGGVRWQIYQWLPGWNYKNLAANGGLFQLGARLAVYTRNETYASKAEQVFDWLLHTSPIMTSEWEVFDGTDVLQNCTNPDRQQWTYNYGIMIGGAAYMYNYTNGSQIWADRLQGFLDHTSVFFHDQYGDVMFDHCEIPQLCNIDQVSFKAYLSRWLAVSLQLAPFTAQQIVPRLQKSAIGAAQACNGTAATSPLPYACGNRWYWNGYDGNGGMGQQIAALSVISANLIADVRPPRTVESGGTSQGDPTLTSDGDDEIKPVLNTREITAASRAAAGVLTVVALMSTMAGGWWLIRE